MKSENFAIVIPARYKSSRLPGKPLIDICGTPMIKRVWDRCCLAVNSEKIYIATENLEIFNYCQTFTQNVLMTSDSCKTGTDRVYEACSKIGSLDFVVNVQGDEPIINPAEITQIIDEYIKNPGKIINGMALISSKNEYTSLTIPKVVFRQDRRLLYMSRAAIPSNKSNEFVKAWKQICIYAFPINALKDFSLANDKTLFEKEEDIEILRFLELGYDVMMKEVEGKSIAVDTLFDAEKVSKLLLKNPDYNLNKYMSY
jgi:3-deoxy-manno-octulosonate cytidylyltransferase (CMP-KDO synthetase)